VSATEERYARATTSSHLKPPKENATGDLDVVAAAGMADGTGTLLLRLRSEFDSVRKAHGMASKNLADSLRLLAAKQIDSERAKAIRADAEAEAIQARAHLLRGLKSLEPAKRELRGYALWLAERRNARLPAFEVTRIADSVIGAWLDPNCPACEGRGFNGGYSGAPQIICTACKGTRSRRAKPFAKSVAGQTLGESLLSEIHAACEKAAGQMAAKLRR
jgi:hypothetical protein